MRLVMTDVAIICGFISTGFITAGLLFYGSAVMFSVKRGFDAAISGGGD